MNNLACRSYINPVLIAKMPTEFAQECFFQLKICFRAEAPKQPSLTYTNAGFVQIRNRSATKIECHGETIDPDMSALFACAFTHHDSMPGIDSSKPALGMKSTLFLERTHDCVFSTNKILMEQGIEIRITVKPSDENLIDDLLKQFERYLEEFAQDHDEDLLDQRKKCNPEFTKYSVDPIKYQQDIKRFRMLVSKTKKILEEGPVPA